MIPPREYLVRLQETCRKYGILFIVDEVQTGVARTGTMFGGDSTTDSLWQINLTSGAGTLVGPFNYSSASSLICTMPSLPGRTSTSSSGRPRRERSSRCPWESPRRSPS